MQREDVMPHNRLLSLIAFAACTANAWADPQYQIYDIGTVNVNDSGSQGFRISGNGVATGRSLRTGGSSAFKYTVGSGLTPLVGFPNPPPPYYVGNGINNIGNVVGSAATTFFGSNRIPIIWQNGLASQLALPSGQTLGDANDINDANIAVGSVGGGSLQRGVVYQGGAAQIIAATTSTGQYFVTAFGINNAGKVVGQGWDPNNAAITVGLIHDMATNTTTSIGALASLGHNSALAFDVSEAGHVVGSSSLNGGANARPFLWTQGSGMVEVSLPTGTTSGSARGVNSSGWVVGTASSAFAIPFLNDGTQTYRLADLLAPGSGWDLSTNTSSSAMGISENGWIVGTGVHNGAVRGYVMVPVPEPTSITVIGLGAAALLRRRRQGHQRS